MLTHEGRKTGRIRHTVLEVIRHDQTSGESIVVSAYGEKADWYRNIRVKTALEIQIGRERYVPIQRFLTPDEIYIEFNDYEQRHPSATRSLLRTLGFHYDGTESGRRMLVASFRMVSFCPKSDV
jgi:deazaflavin-dependent oxidoreductase (nitroreductase family)